MGLVFKNLGKDNIQITPHTAHKQWDLSLAEANAVGIKSYLGKYIPGDFSIHSVIVTQQNKKENSQTK